MGSQVQYLPLAPGFFLILVFLFVGLIILIQLRILRYAYMKLGLSPGAALFLLFGSLIGSYFNIPITVLPGAPVRSSGSFRRWTWSSSRSRDAARATRATPTRASPRC